MMERTMRRLLEECRQLLFALGGLGGLLAAGPVVLLLELLDAAGRVNELHLAGEERMAGRANFDGDVLLGAAGRELVAAATGHRGGFVLGVNVFLHRWLRAKVSETLYCRSARTAATRGGRFGLGIIVAQVVN